jgi:nitrous oxidase accessory protein
VRVRDALYGISAGPCKHCLIENSHVIGDGAADEFRGDAIKLWEAHDSRVQGCRVESSRDVVVWYSRRVLLDGNLVTGSRYGTHFMYAHDSVVRNSRITDNVVGIFVMYSARMRLEDNVLAGARGAAGMGVGFKDSDGVQVRRNWLVANTVGSYLDRTPVSPRFPVLFADNVIALNQLALRIHGAERGARFTRNDFTQNVSLAEVEGGGDALGLEFSGNHWSDYAGYDLNADGVGDVAFQLKQLSSDMQQRHPTLKFFEGTAALRLVDWISHAVPVLTSQLILVDPAPAIRSHRSRS